MELVLATVLIAVALLAALAVTAGAIRTMAVAAAREGALELAGEVMDSLVLVVEPTGSEVEREGFVVRWTVEEDGGLRRIEVEIESMLADLGTFRLVALHAPLPPLTDPDR